LLERVNAGSCSRGNGEHRRIGQASAVEQGRDFRLHLGYAVCIHPIDLCNRDRALTDVQEIENCRVLARLWHHSIVAGHDEQHEVDARDPAQHIVDESFMARHIDKPDCFIGLERQVGESEIDRHAPFLFLGQTIGIDSSQRPDQERLPMINVAGRCNDHVCSALGTMSFAIWAAKPVSSSRQRKSRMNWPS
jgi:hypothetical protein